MVESVFTPASVLQSGTYCRKDRDWCGDQHCVVTGEWPVDRGKGIAPGPTRAPGTHKERGDAEPEDLAHC